VCSAGNKAAFGQLIDRYRAGAIAFARRLLGDSDAEDAAQEAFVAAFLGLNKLRRKEAFRPWLFGILVNLCRSRLRSRRSEYFQDFLGGEAIAGFRLQDWAPSAEAIFEVRGTTSIGC
jgi:RNA polymerase sigma factor (sigma-70 family)